MEALVDYYRIPLSEVKDMSIRERGNWLTRMNERKAERRSHG